MNHLHPTYKVHHNNLENSVLFFKVRTSELFFVESPESKQEECSFTLRYLLQEVNKEGNTLVDSNTYIFQFRKSDLKRYYLTQIPIKAREGNSYRMKVTLRDNKRKSFNVSYIDIEKSKGLGEQYFNVTTTTGTPLFKNVIINNGLFKINHSLISEDTIFVKYFSNNIPAPKPLINSLSDDYHYSKYDSLFIVKYNANSVFSLPYEGMYYVQFDTNSKEGVSILKLNKDFPKVQKPEGLLPPLTYITSDAEFNNLMKGKNPKLAADNFWIKTGGSPERGRELIRLYYNRVYFANYYFSNSRAGWKTDRGMVYIVYGPPHKMKKTAHSETWIYKRKSDDKPIEFTFKYSPNSYHINNYQLDRSGNSEWHWTEAVFAWSSGDIFLYD
jgi:GWxTD domain-containing protein